MTKIYLSLSVALAALALTGCKPKLRTARAKVATIEMVSDTLRSMTVTVEDDSLRMTLDYAEFTNGVVMPGDSVSVDYVKMHGQLKALTVRMLPRPVRYLDVDHDAPVKTAP